MVPPRLTFCSVDTDTFTVIQAGYPMVVCNDYGSGNRAAAMLHLKKAFPMKMNLYPKNNIFPLPRTEVVRDTLKIKN
ncbi:hypothetical protein WM40_03490 [Robbsia andropogonis]|uniref:Uncharacterized protein n=1 Tax=Robbsia andropogonis TaxID=28092 RepID=A0A0F5K672_9BURK|nr:hypothetical protein WM40_03490 [Robbsia andropogonis]